MNSESAGHREQPDVPGAPNAPSTRPRAFHRRRRTDGPAFTHPDQYLGQSLYPLRAAFPDPHIVPVDALEGTDLHLAHLSNGPTAAFKDMAMQLLGELFEYELTRRGDWLTIVGATSGDTGSSGRSCAWSGGREHHGVRQGLQ